MNTNEYKEQSVSSENEIYEEGSDENMIDIKIKIDEQSFSAKLYENKSTQQLIDLFPLRIDMNDLNSNEKYYYLDQGLPTNSQHITNIKSGDIMLFGTNCLVLFYKSFQTSYSYTKLGFIEDVNRFEEVVGKRNLQVVFELQ